MITPEQLARQQIDTLLIAAGWSVQDYTAYQPNAARGVALREVPLASGRCDYLLLVDRQPLGVIEAKRSGTLLVGVAEQSAHYAASLPAFFKVMANELPFAYESTGTETFFRDARDPAPRSRPVFAFHQPATLAALAAEPDTLRARLQRLPPLIETNLRACQVEAVKNLDASFAQDKPRALIQMATGAGKTTTAISFIYRLIKHAGAKRVLFLVDRSNLGKQTAQEFAQYTTPDDGRKFTELYNVQHMTGGSLDGVARVTVCTIQRLYSMLRGEDLADDVDEHSSFELSADGRPKEVAYNPQLPIETFDFVVTDECHRSIYNLWRQVLEYFDAHLIGLTATPSKQTIGFFNGNLGGTGSGTLNLSAHIVGSVTAQAEMGYALFMSPDPFDLQTIVDAAGSSAGFWQVQLPNSVRVLFSGIASRCGMSHASKDCGHVPLRELPGASGLTSDDKRSVYFRTDLRRRQPL